MTDQEPQAMPPSEEPSVEAEPARVRVCKACGKSKPLPQFQHRSRKRSKFITRYRSVCRSCRKRKRKVGVPEPGSEAVSGGLVLPAAPPRPRIRKPLPAPPPKPDGPDPSVLRLTREGIIRMRGRTDKGRRWQQETDLETAVVLVKEYAAVVVNRHTIRRIYTNKSFREYILSRDRFTCHFCGDYGDTIDHLLPRAKGGHTTPVNCVCACNLCNQSKADRTLDDFLRDDG